MSWKRRLNLHQNSEKQKHWNKIKEGNWEEVIENNINSDARQQWHIVSNTTEKLKLIALLENIEIIYYCKHHHKSRTKSALHKEINAWVLTWGYRKRHTETSTKKPRQNIGDTEDTKKEKLWELKQDRKYYKHQNAMKITTQDSERHDMNTDTRNNINITTRQ